jgi:hypothetical protein
LIRAVAMLGFLLLTSGCVVAPGKAYLQHPCVGCYYYLTVIVAARPRDRGDGSVYHILLPEKPAPPARYIAAQLQLSDGASQPMPLQSGTLEFRSKRRVTVTLSTPTGPFPANGSYEYENDL